MKSHDFRTSEPFKPLTEAELALCPQFRPRAELVGASSAMLPRHVRFSEVMALTGLKKSTLRAIQNPRAAQYDPSFPPSFRLTARTIVWNTHAILRWLESKQVIHASAGNPTISSSQEC